MTVFTTPGSCLAELSQARLRNPGGKHFQSTSVDAHPGESYGQPVTSCLARFYNSPPLAETDGISPGQSWCPGAPAVCIAARGPRYVSRSSVSIGSMEGFKEFGPSKIRWIADKSSVLLTGF